MPCLMVNVYETTVLTNNCQHPYQKELSQSLTFLGKPDFIDTSISTVQQTRLTQPIALVEWDVFKAGEKAMFTDENLLGRISYLNASPSSPELLSILISCSEDYFNTFYEVVMKPYLNNPHNTLACYFNYQGFDYDASNQQIQPRDFAKFMQGFKLAKKKFANRKYLTVTGMHFSLTRTDQPGKA